jgi:hypothetical protein
MSVSVERQGEMQKRPRKEAKRRREKSARITTSRVKLVTGLSQIFWLFLRGDAWYGALGVSRSFKAI